MECSSLVEELRRYCTLTKLLQKSLVDTRKTFKDINAAKCMIDNQTVVAEMSPVEEATIHTMAANPPCIVVLGQSIQSRVNVANLIFGEDILPTPGVNMWHTLVLRYGARNRINVLEDTMEHSIKGSNASTKRCHLWKNTIPLEELEVYGAIGESIVLDVRANHPLLHCGARVAVGSSVGNLMQSYQMCVRDTIPIVVFAVHGSSLSNDEINLLQFIRKSDHSLPIYFVKMSGCGESRSVGDELHISPEPSVISGSSPGLFRQLVELEFFTDMSSQNSDAATSRPPSEVKHSLSDTIVASHETRITETVDKADSYVIMANVSSDSTHNKASNSTHSENSSSLELAACGNTGTEKEHLMWPDGNMSKTHSPFDTEQHATGVLSAMAVERTLSDVDSESCIAAADSEIVEGLGDGFCSGLANFARSMLQARLLSTVSLLYTIHHRCLETMITLAFDMAWDVVCTPTRIKFARNKEEELYNSLMRVALKKQDEIKQIIIDTIASEEEALLQSASMHQFTGSEPLEDSGEMKTFTVQYVKDCTAQIQDLVIARLNAAISCKLLTLVSVLHDSYTGVLTRCLASLEQKDVDVDGSKSTETSDALREILNAAYNVEITVCSGTSFVKTLIEKMKQLMHGVLLRTPSSLDDTWKRKVALNVLSSLTEARCQRLAKSICAQIKDRVRRSHAVFEASLQRLEVHHNGRLQQTERQRLNVRKEYAPRIARLSLESRSLRDLILYGKPVLGPEIGRGQYGVVYSCDSWAGCIPCAVKSVAPPDDRHWNDLALEFHYTTNIPEHCRIVSLRGSIIDYTYGSGSSRNPAVLLIMDRFKCDLYAAIERRMNWLSRLQVAVDVVEGIRYLHARGLVHRDIKLKNVLLDADNRGRLTDLGFCKPEAMISGSIVGTPLHMAPELVTGKYDHSVDVYAFGVLFWYVCAGTVRLPTHFEVCTNKDMLFTLVRKGLRPERPPDCDRECWELMNRCWDGEPVRRPHVGELEISLRAIYDRFVASSASSVDQSAATAQEPSANDELTEIDIIESMTTDSDLDLTDVTLQ